MNIKRNWVIVIERGILLHTSYRLILPLSPVATPTVAKPNFIMLLLIIHVPTLYDYRPL